MHDQSLRQVGAACSRKALSYTSQTVPEKWRKVHGEHISTIGDIASRTSLQALSNAELETYGDINRFANVETKEGTNTDCAGLPCPTWSPAPPLATKKQVAEEFSEQQRPQRSKLRQDSAHLQNWESRKHLP